MEILSHKILIIPETNYKVEDKSEVIPKLNSYLSIKTTFAGGKAKQKWGNYGGKRQAWGYQLTCEMIVKKLNFRLVYSGKAVWEEGGR